MIYPDLSIFVQDMKPGDIKTEPKTEPFDDGDKAAQQQQQQSTSQTASNTTTFIDTISNSEGNEILVLVPASSNNGLTNTEYTKDTNDITRNLERKANDSHSNHSNRNIVTEQILWIPKIEAQTREDFGQHQQQQQQHQVTTGNVGCQPPPLYSRIMQLNYPQVDNVFRHHKQISFFFFSLLFQNFSIFHHIRIFANPRSKFVFFLFELND